MLQHGFDVWGFFFFFIRHSPLSLNNILLLNKNCSRIIRRNENVIIRRTVGYVCYRVNNVFFIYKTIINAVIIIRSENTNYLIEFM